MLELSFVQSNLKVESDVQMTFKEINFPKSFTYSNVSENIPLEFFDSVFPVAVEVDIVLGYFSSNAIRRLAESIALFLYGGGKMRIITNQFYNEEDYNNLFKSIDIENDDKFLNLFDDLEVLKNSLSSSDQHFFDCLGYLQREKRLEIIPIKYSSGLAHMKNYIFRDREGNTICTSGSINFTYSGILVNSEQITVYASWTNEQDEARVYESVEIFNKIYHQKIEGYTRLTNNQLEKVVPQISNNKELDELLVDSHRIIEKAPKELLDKIALITESRENKFSKELQRIKLEPRKPRWFSPRDYQSTAYRKWIENSRQGIFNMATGTGKTLTSLNIVLNEYYNNGAINLFILVPTAILLDQWVEECKAFNLINIITSKERRYPEILGRLSRKVDEKGFAPNFVFITTYANFSKPKFQKIFSSTNFPELTCIFDECHNIGSRSMLRVLPKGIPYRIGLSATPQRMFDDTGNNKMYEYFNSYPDCFTFTYGMLKAINNEMLCPYFYYPIFIYLNDEELTEYKKFTPKLMAHFDSKTNKFDEEGERLLMLRKQIIHKASNKLIALKNLVSELDDLKYTFIYAPEGKFLSIDQDEFEEEEEDVKIIREYTEVINGLGHRARSLTGASNDRENSLINFQEGRLDTLIAMKVLDEGVNIPITKRAIFCSSTGNPRQFIQRRGRVLRTHKASNKKHADIYDLIVLPFDPKLHEEEINPLEKRIIHSEVKRAADFAYAAINKEDLTTGELSEICSVFEIDLDSLIKEKLEAEKVCEYENTP